MGKSLERLATIAAKFCALGLAFNSVDIPKAYAQEVAGEVNGAVMLTVQLIPHDHHSKGPSGHLEFSQLTTVGTAAEGQSIIDSSLRIHGHYGPEALSANFGPLRLNAGLGVDIWFSGEHFFPHLEVIGGLGIDHFDAEFSIIPDHHQRHWNARLGWHNHVLQLGVAVGHDEMVLPSVIAFPGDALEALTHADLPHVFAVRGDAMLRHWGVGLGYIWSPDVPWTAVLHLNPIEWFEEKSH